MWTRDILSNDEHAERMRPYRALVALEPDLQSVRLIKNSGSNERWGENPITPYRKPLRKSSL